MQVANRPQQVTALNRLQQVSGGAGSGCAMDILVTVAGGKRNDASLALRVGRTRALAALP